MQTGNCLQCMSKLQLLIDATIYKISQRDDKYNVQFELEWLRRVTNVYISNVNQDGIKSLMLLQNGKEKKEQTNDSQEQRALQHNDHIFM